MKSTMQCKPYEKPGLEPMGMDGRNGMHTKDMSNGMPRVMGIQKKSSAAFYLII